MSYRLCITYVNEKELGLCKKRYLSKINDIFLLKDYERLVNIILENKTERRIITDMVAEKLIEITNKRECCNCKHCKIEIVCIGRCIKCNNGDYFEPNVKKIIKQAIVECGYELGEENDIGV